MAGQTGMREARQNEQPVSNVKSGLAVTSGYIYDGSPALVSALDVPAGGMIVTTIGGGFAAGETIAGGGSDAASPSNAPASSNQGTAIPADQPAGFTQGNQFQFTPESGGLVQLATGDLNGDGYPDLVAGWEVGVGTQDQPIEILLNDGSDHFSDGSSLVSGSLPTVAHPQQIVIAPLQGTGQNDIFVADHGYDATPFPGHQQRLMEWGTDGKLHDVSTTNLPQELTFTHRVTFGDVNGDGAIDILYANLPPSSRPQLLKNNGQGSFSLDQGDLPTAVTSGGNGNTGALLADLNGDGYADLVLGGWDPLHTGMHSSVLYLNDGSGSFDTTPITLPAPAIPLVSGIGPTALDIRSADINGDGKPDLIIDWTNGDYTSHYYQILINQGNGQFADETQQLLPQTIQADYWTVHIYLVDLRNNGNYDIVAQPISTQAPTYYLNDGTGHFTVSGTFGQAGEIIAPLVISGGTRTDFAATFNNGAGNVYINGLALPNVLSGQWLDVAAGQTSSGWTVYSGGTLNVLSGGTAVGTIVDGGGHATVSSGGTATNTIISGAAVNGASPGGIVEFAAGGIASGGIVFGGIGGTLRFDTNAGGAITTAAISGFTPGDTIDLTAVGFSISGSITASGSTLAVKENGQTYDLNLDPSHSIAGWELKLSSDGITGTDIRLGGQTDDFNFDRTSDILFRNDSSGDTWFEAMSNGAVNGWNQIGGSSTSYTAVGVGDFYGTGTSDALFLNVTTGDTWVEAISNGAFAGWNQIGGSNTNYSVIGVADFYGNATEDILFRDNSTGDTWFEAISNGAFAGWHQIGGSDTTYAVVGTGDFHSNGTDDILFRNNSSGDTWIEAISNGAFAGWHQIGGSDTHYSVVGVGDFYGDGTDDILFRNASTGDTWIEAISNGAFKTWSQVGGSDTHYAVVGVGDYFGNGTNDILFRNNSTGDTWFEVLSNGNFGWHQVGGSNTSYIVKT